MNEENDEEKIKHIIYEIESEYGDVEKEQKEIIQVKDIINKYIDKLTNAREIVLKELEMTKKYAELGMSVDKLIDFEYGKILEQERDEFNKKIDEFNKKINELEEKIKDKSDELDGANKQLTVANKKLASANKELELAKLRIRELEEKNENKEREGIQ